ncbi:MAG: hypothetical protein WCW27_02160 [Patescibacteria group bacterium]|jgi:hypothetical protein
MNHQPTVNLQKYVKQDLIWFFILLTVLISGLFILYYFDRTNNWVGISAERFYHFLLNN